MIHIIIDSHESKHLVIITRTSASNTNKKKYQYSTINTSTRNHRCKTVQDLLLFTSTSKADCYVLSHKKYSSTTNTNARRIEISMAETNQLTLKVCQFWISYVYLKVEDCTHDSKELELTLIRKPEDITIQGGLIIQKSY